MTTPKTTSSPKRSHWIRPLRTAVQSLIGLMPAIPLLVPALGLDVTVGVGATLVAIAAITSRVMATPLGERILSTLGLHTRSLSPGERELLETIAEGRAQKKSLRSK